MDGDELAELVVVEGVSDAVAVRRAVDADVVVTGGFALGPDASARIRRAAAVRGVVVLTDSDGAGEQIRRRVALLAPEARHARVPAALCRGRDGRVGVEHASPEAIRDALAAARAPRRPARAPTFAPDDLRRLGLCDEPGARERRAAVGERLGLGYGNARQLLRRLNAYEVSPAELDAAVESVSQSVTAPSTAASE
ncbi:MAG: DUF4093 domain-containing protein [Myxococcota bacterium]